MGDSCTTRVAHLKHFSVVPPKKCPRAGGKPPGTPAAGAAFAPLKGAFIVWSHWPDPSVLMSLCSAGRSGLVRSLEARIWPVNFVERTTWHWHGIAAGSGTMSLPTVCMAREDGMGKGSGPNAKNGRRVRMQSMGGASSPIYRTNLATEAGSRWLSRPLESSESGTVWLWSGRSIDRH